MTSASLSVFDPTLIDGVRNQLADEFARRIFDAIPDISECIEFEADACISTAGKKRFERAAQLLYSGRRDLQLQTAATVRRLFDERLLHLLDGAGSTTRLSLDSMTLVADERLDEEIAINHCSRRLKEQCEFELWGLTQRIIVLAGIDRPADNQNPVYTQTFAQALMEAINSLEADASVRLVIFKTFGPVLLEIVPAVYTAANRALTARGIDVESGEYYGRPVLTPERQAASLPTQQEIVLGTARANLELTSTLTKILAKTAPSLPLPVEPQDDVASVAPLATTAQPSMLRPGNVAGSARLAGLPERASKTAQPAIEQAAGAQKLHAARQALQEKLNRDEKVIGDIVSAMFERLRADPRMPVQLRAIVARLHCPVLELALRDRSLLTQVQHPVRKLIDLIAEFGLTLGLGNDDDSKVRSVENVLDGLVRIQHVEPNAFKLAFEQLDALFYHHEEAALQNDDNLRTLERHEAAGFAASQADREIALRLQNLVLPAAISAFIQTTWRDVLAHDYLSGGPKGKAWKLGLTTLDDIVKSLRHSTDPIERRRLAKSLPAAIESQLNTPERGEVQDVYRDLQSANFFAELHRVHELAFTGKWTEIGGERFVPSLDALAASSSIASPSATLTSLGLACGDWIETRDFAGVRRWRLSWITSILGTCVFKHYESNTTRAMSCEELRERLAAGEVHRVRGLGLADDVLNGAFEAVSHKARREETLLAAGVPGSADRSAPNQDLTQWWDDSAPAQTFAVEWNDHSSNPVKART